MINFLKYSKIYLVLSGLIIALSVFAIANYGLKLSIDFTGGSVLNYRLSKPEDPATISRILNDGKIETISVQNDNNTSLIKIKSTDKSVQDQAKKLLEDKLSTGIEVLRVESVGPTLGRETIEKTITAALVAMVGILIYISFSFKKVTYGLAAVTAMIHDLIVLTGIYAFLTHYSGAEVDALFVTALLTTLSFSVHDTIVVFDKVREYDRTTSFPIEIKANKALTETMVRSINNSITIVLMLIPLVLFGGETIRYFAAALLIGTVVGTYSSPFVATPLLVFFENVRSRRR